MPHGTFPKSNLDGRVGLGYGTSSSRFNPRQSNSSFPYQDEDDEELDDSIFDDIDIIKVSKKINSPYLPSDFGAKAKTTKDYFVAGNTKLSDCFFRADKILLEIETFNNSLVPIPDLYKGSTRVGGPGAFLPGGLGTQRRTGTKKGYASAPPVIHDLEEEEDEDLIFSLEDIALKSDIHDGYA